MASPQPNSSSPRSNATPTQILLAPSLKPGTALQVQTGAGGFMSPGMSTGGSNGSMGSLDGPAHIPYPTPNSETAKPLLPSVSETVVTFVVAAASADKPGFQKTAEAIKNAKVQIKNEGKADGSTQVIVQITGGAAEVGEARSKILRSLPVTITQTTQGPAADLTTNGELKPVFKARFDSIGKATETTIKLSTLPVKAGEVSLDITGLSAKVDQAKLRLLIALDEIAGLSVVKLCLPAKVIPALAGRRRIAVEHMMKEHGCNIYIPTSAAPVGEDEDMELVITGPSEAIEGVRTHLQSFATKKQATILTQNISMTPYKTEWLLLTSWDKVREIMDNTGVFIGFPPSGTPVDHVNIYGDKPALMTKCISKLLNLCGSLISSQIFLSKQAFEISKASTSSLQLPNLDTLQQIATDLAKTGAEVVYKDSTFYMYGEEGDVLAGLLTAQKNALIVASVGEYRLSVELISEHRDFLSGKKNGKINKVMRTAGAKVRFFEFNTQNMIVDISSNIAERTQEGYRLIKDELPADLTFHVPESAHKRIIGVGGKSIQSIMKQFGVYVKFAGADEFLSVGGMLPQEENVIVRTPAKNGANLFNLKQSITEMVYGQNVGPVTLGLTVPRRFHFWLATTKHHRIADIEQRTGITIKFPPREFGSPVLTLVGIEASAHLAASMLKDLLPVQLDYAIPPSAELKKTLDTNDWKDTERRLRNELEVWVSARQSEEDGSFVLRMWTARVTAGFLKAAVAQVVEALQSHKVPLLANQSSREEVPKTPLIDKKMGEFPIMDRNLTSSPADAPAVVSPLTAGGQITVQNISSGLVPRETPVISTTPSVWAGLDSPKRRLSPSRDDNAMTNAINAISMHSATPPSPTIRTGRRESVLRSAIIPDDHERSASGSRSANWRKGPDVDPKLSKFLEQLDLGVYASALASQDVDYSMLLTLSEDDLKELGITFGARRKIMNAIKDQRSVAAKPQAPHSANMAANGVSQGTVSQSPTTRVGLRPTASTFTPINTKVPEKALSGSPSLVSPSLAAPRPNGFNMPSNNRGSNH